jgi:hemerythrin-like domain-containing protein
MTVIKDLLRLQTDIAVAGGEMLLSRFSRKRIARRARRGDRQPVLLLPGYMAGDSSMTYMANFLNECGFDAHTWGLGQNTGFQGESGAEHMDEFTGQIIERVRKLSDGGRKKVALVGHSFGGLYSRETAARYPDEIDRVITMGSPTIHPYISDDQNTFVIKIASRKDEEGHKFSITGKTGFLHWGARHPALPCITIWSPIDAVVFSQSARIPDYIVQLSDSPAIRENVRIICSHAGMVVNEAVLLAVADRLAQPLDNWRDFDARDYYSDRAIGLVEKAFGNRLFHEFIYSDWREDAAVERSPLRPMKDDQPSLMRQLRQDHNDFYQLYKMIEDSIENGSFGSESDYLLLADVARFMTDYLDRRHHPLEEFVFKEVLKFYPDAREALQRLSLEHGRIEKEGENLLRQVEHASDPRNPRQPKRLLARWRRFCETLRRHVELEEEILFPQAEANIPDRAWAIIERDWKRKTGTLESPLGETADSQEFRQLFEYLSYIASRDQRTPGLAEKSLSGLYLDSVVYATEKLDALVEKKHGK